MNKISETKAENIFRGFYGPDVFIEKSAIPSEYGFTSKRGTSHSGYPDFFLDHKSFAIIVEAKPLKHSAAEDDVKFYMENNKIRKDIIGIAVSGQELNQIKVTYFYKIFEDKEMKSFLVKDILLSLGDLEKTFNKNKYGESISDENLVLVLKSLNKRFNNENKVRDTDRSLFFSGLIIALTNVNFRSTYKGIQAPSKEEVTTTRATVLESYNLNKAIVSAISSQLESKINNLSKEYSWKDKFSFIKNVDYPLIEYKDIIETIETRIFQPYLNEEKQDILGKAYKIFLSRAGKIDNKNIILTPDHIKSLMVKLARLTKDDVVLDTCTGSGGFLMESMEMMMSLAKGDLSKINHIKEKQLIGFETDSVLFALACSNMFLHGDGRTNLLFRSSLLDTRRGSMVNSNDADILEYIKKMKPTKCIINPPYESNNPIKFTKQAIDYIEPNGKLIIIMPTPTLTHNEGGLTEQLLEVAKLDFVIKMPMALFTEQKRTVNTSIFGFTKTPHSQNDNVLFYNLEDDGFKSIQHKGRVDKLNKWNDIENNILDAINNSKEIESVCQKKKIYKEVVLNCAGIQIKRKSNYEMVQIMSLFDLQKGTLASNDADEGGDYDFITASNEWKKHSTFSHDTEAIIYAVAAGGSLGRTHYVKGKFTASNLCLVMTPKKDSPYKVNFEFYNWYFAAIRKRIVSDLADGTSKLTISKPDLEKYYIDYIPIEKQSELVEKKISKYDQLKEKLNEAEDDLRNTVASIV
ncbi:N-6 DNA methylase [Patescibacteria group bacterium]|nr:N-6 DNA methylase [Patescibacteria group bacterium]